MHSESDPTKVLSAESQRLEAFAGFWKRRYGRQFREMKFSLTTSIELISRRNSKQHLISLYPPIIILGSLDGLRGLRIPHQSGNGQLQELAQKILELLVDGNNNFFLRCI